MKVNCQRDISFKSIYTNKAVKKGLEFASSNGALFGASASVIFSVLRPASIWLTPKTDKENRKVAAAKSITSSIINLGLVFAISNPLSRAICNIDKNPLKYLTPQTIAKYKDKGKSITSSKGYIFSTQFLKLSIAALVVVPKSILTAKGIPWVAKYMNSNKQNDTQNNINFKGKFNEKNTDIAAKILNSKRMQKISDKFKNTNFPMHITAMTDAIGTLAFIRQTAKSDKIQENRKKPLIYNSVIATSLSLICGYTADKLLDKPTENFIKKFRVINKNDKNLEKQIQGIKIAKPFLILGTIYYVLIPIISTFLAEKADENLNKNLLS